MHSFSAIIQKSGTWGEKSGWTFVYIPPDILTKLKLKSNKEFRVKGFIDDVKIERQTCFPVGEGNFIITLNADLRKKLGKKHGAMVILRIALDARDAAKSQELMDCLEDDAAAKAQFESMNKANQNYFHNYINTAKTAGTKTERVLNTINAMLRKQNFGEMIRGLKATKNS